MQKTKRSNETTPGKREKIQEVELCDMCLGDGVRVSGTYEKSILVKCECNEELDFSGGSLGNDDR